MHTQYMIKKLVAGAASIATSIGTDRVSAAVDQAKAVGAALAEKAQPPPVPFGNLRAALPTPPVQPTAVAEGLVRAAKFVRTQVQARQAAAGQGPLEDDLNLLGQGATGAQLA